MKKLLLTSVACAVAMTAGTAMAAKVKVDGRVDMGIGLYHSAEKDDEGVVTRENKGQLMSGQNSTSRVRLRGSEDLGDGLTVGFTLDTGFEADNGEMKGERLFQREALLWLKGNWGEIGLGRCGVLDSGNGRYGLIQEDWAVVAGTGWEELMDPRKQFYGQNSRQDNVITYKTPTFGGVTGYLQYSTAFETVQDDKVYYSDGTEGTSDSNRYMAAAVTGEFGALSVVGIASLVDISCKDKNAFKDENPDGSDDDALSVTLGAKYAFDDSNLYVAAQYYDNGHGEGMKKFGASKKVYKNFYKGWGLVLSADTKAFGGKVYGLVGYGEGDMIDVEENDDMKNYQFGVGYEYKFSKKTHAYVAAGYVYDRKGLESEKLVNAMCGLVTKF